MEGKGPYSFMCFNHFSVVSGHPIAACVHAVFICHIHSKDVAACVHAVFICHIHSKDVTALRVQADLYKNLQSDDVKQQPSNEGNDLVHDGDNEHMGSEEDVAAAKVKAKNAGRRKNEKLYDAAGILNTKLMRAGKKANKSSGDAMEDDEDYDFKVDYVKKGSAMDDGEENEEAGGSNQTIFEVLASRVENDE